MTAHSERENCHAERIRAVDPSLAKREKFVERNPELFGKIAEIFAHHIPRERIVAGGHWRMRAENVRRGHDLERRIKLEFFLNDLPANALQREKRRVALVHVENFRVDLQRFQSFHAANAEHDFLAHPHFLIAAVKLGRDQAIFGVVFGNVGVEEEEIDPADRQLPNLGEDFAVQNSNRDEKIRSVTLHFSNRQVMKILIEADRVLYAVLVDLLPEIAMAIKQPDG